MPISSTDDPLTISNCGVERVADVDLDGALVEPPVAQLLPEPLARALRLLARRRQVSSSVPLVTAGGSSRSSSRSSAALAGLLPHFAGALLAHHVDGELDQVAHHRLDVAAHVADLGELRRLDLDEGRVRQPRQAARDLGLADARRPDHQDVLRRHLLGQVRRQLLPAQAIAQRDGDGALGRALTDDVLVEFRDDLPRASSLRRWRPTFSGR